VSPSAWWKTTTSAIAGEDTNASLSSASATTEPGRASSRDTPALSAHGLSKRFGDRVAFEDVSFEIGYGEVVGIIGRNGAGKSTLLKILSRITEPTEGSVEIRGRVGSLLEVGTGFHSELTGRENVYLNGAILNMRRSEIDRQFDSIVDFSGLEKFIDTPVKHYSSGMHVRLAFAVAAHLDPEILILDEVLAVGDLAFQNKCLAKVGDVVRSGRTVLFVSHNMETIMNLCPRAILLRTGSVVMDGPTEGTVREYLSYLTSSAKDAFHDNPEREGDGRVRLISATSYDETNHPSAHLVAGRPASLAFEYVNPGQATGVTIRFTIFNQLGVAVSHFDSAMQEEPIDDLGASGRFVCRIPDLPLPLGQYRIAVAVNVHGDIADLIPNALVFDVESSVFFDTGRSPSLRFCAAMIRHDWSHETEPAAAAAAAFPHSRRSS